MLITMKINSENSVGQNETFWGGGITQRLLLRTISDGLRGLYRVPGLNPDWQMPYPLHYHSRPLEHLYIKAECFEML